MYYKKVIKKGTKLLKLQNKREENIEIIIKNINNYNSASVILKYYWFG